MTPLQSLLAKLSEEGGEVSQSAVKASLYGLKGKHPTTGVVNDDHLVYEINDLLAVIELIKEEPGVDVEAFNGIGNAEAIAAAKAKIIKNLGLAYELGNIVVPSNSPGQ